MRLLRVFVVRVIGLRRIDRGAIRRREIGIVRRRVIRDGIVGIVGDRIDLPAEIAAGIDHIPIGELALDGERRLVPFVGRAIGREVADLEIARLLGIEQEGAVGALVLVDEPRRHGPIVVEVVFERGAAAIGIDVVEVLLHIFVVVDAQRRRRRSRR